MSLLALLLKRTVNVSNQISKRKRLTPIAQQKKVLKKLLHQAAITQFGVYYHFDEILQSKNMFLEFKKRVPLHDYDLIAPWWQKAEAGEPDVTWPGKVKYFALSSGTSGSPSKHIPVTREMIKSMQKVGRKEVLVLDNYKFPAKIFDKQFLSVGGSTNLVYNGINYRGDLSGIQAKKQPRWFKPFFKPEKEITDIRDWETKLQKMVERAPKWDVGIIAGVPAWVQILIERIIQQYNLKHIHELWPDFQLYIHGGVSIEPYRKKLNSLFGRDVLLIDTYLASEGFIACQIHPDNRGMLLSTDSGIYYEFLPFNDDNFDPDGNLKDRFAKTLTLSQVELHKPYALILSTCAGAWRYLIGDVIKFVCLDPYEIIIDGRTKHFLSICGEHLSVDNMTMALKKACEIHYTNVNEFTVIGIPVENRHTHKWYLGTEDINLNKETFIKTLDEQLCMLNDDYATERKHALKDPQVEVLPTHVFHDFLAYIGKTGGQHKFPRVLKGKPLEQWNEYLAKYVYNTNDC
ncbi:MAG: GH3 auxin-responsive promoter family protein [Bacteroidia bacterium]|nr:GH3 auxin-responsive promoter family protein [Bacteroidia bacterium]MDW8345736.1 GH3 auxin-responsive promoter family protein [Bacteroidia bacterium]